MTLHSDPTQGRVVATVLAMSLLLARGSSATTSELPAKENSPEAPSVVVPSSAQRLVAVQSLLGFEQAYTAADKLGRSSLLQSAIAHPDGILEELVLRGSTAVEFPYCGQDGLEGIAAFYSGIREKGKDFAARLVPDASNRVIKSVLMSNPEAVVAAAVSHLSRDTRGEEFYDKLDRYVWLTGQFGERGLPASQLLIDLCVEQSKLNGADHESIARDCLRALGSMGAKTPQTIKLAREFLGHPSLGRSAAELLGSMGVLGIDQATQAIITETDTARRSRMIENLDVMGAPGIQVLIECLALPSTRSQAVAVLAEIGPDALRAKAALKQLLDDDLISAVEREKIDFALSRVSSSEYQKNSPGFTISAIEKFLGSKNSRDVMILNQGVLRNSYDLAVGADLAEIGVLRRSDEGFTVWSASSFSGTW